MKKFNDWIKKNKLNESNRLVDTNLDEPVVGFRPISGKKNVGSVKSRTNKFIEFLKDHPPQSNVNELKDLIEAIYDMNDPDTKNQIRDDLNKLKMKLNLDQSALDNREETEEIEEEPSIEGDDEHGTF